MDNFIHVPGFEVGPAKYLEAPCEVWISRYREDNSLCIQLQKGGEPQAVATVCLEGGPPLRGYVWLKGWSENEGIPDALERAGVCARTGRFKPTGFVQAEEARLSRAFEEAMRAALSEPIAL